MSSKVLRIAVFMPRFKWERINLDRVTPSAHGIELVPADFSTDLDSFDGIIHKFTYQLADGHRADVERVRDYAQRRGDMLVIEPIDRIAVFLDRRAMQDLIARLPAPPNVRYVAGTCDLGSVAAFPALLKPVEACGTAGSHSLRIVHDAAQLRALPADGPQLMAFPFVRHYGTVFKCYSLGRTCVMRAAGSLVLHGAEAAQFDSQKPLPAEIANAAFGADDAQRIAPSQEELREIAQFLQSATGIQLLGFDVLRDEETNQLCIVDVNYFPCFRGIENISDRFAEFIKERAEQMNMNKGI